MSKINDLIEFLRLDRRHEEAEAKNQGIDQTKVTITTIDTNETRVINRTEFENTNIYLRIVNPLDKYKPTDFYVLPQIDKSIYYIKIDAQIDGFNYLNLENNRCEKVDDEQLLQKIEIGFATNHYFYDKNNRDVVFSNEILEDVVVFGDRILFDPEKLDVTTATYSYSYSKPSTTFCQFVTIIIDVIKLAFPFSSFFDEKKNIQVFGKPKKGTIYLIPTINEYYEIGKDVIYTISYYYTSSNKKMFYQINEEDVALHLEFNSVEPFLSYLNETIFTQESFDYNNTDVQERRLNFVDDFDRIIVKPLEAEIIGNVSGFYYDIMIKLFYLTDSVALHLSNDSLWAIFEEAIKRNSLTNKLSLPEENVFVKLLEIIAQNESIKDNFLNRLLRKKGNTNTTYLEFLFNSIHGDNGTTFAKLVNKVWKQSRFVNPDPNQNKEFKTTNGPIILPYESEKCLGFYFSNAAVNFALNKDNQTKLHVRFETGKYKEELRPALKSDRLEKVNVPIMADYDYHPFYPIYLKNVEKQETSLKLDAIVPAFMLMANQNQQFWHNVIKTGEYGLDALSIASGFGALAEFRYLRTISQLAVEAEEVSAATKIARAANILANVKGASGILQITSGAVNTMLKITELDETEFGQKISKVLFFLELITLAAEITVPMKNGLKNVAKEAIEESDGVLRTKYPELYDELYNLSLEKAGNLVYKAISEDILLKVPKDKVSQASKVLDKLYIEADIANKQLIKKTDIFAKGTKGKAGFRDGLKSKERAIEKINSDYNGDASQLLDIAGSKVVYNSLDELYRALKTFNKENKILKFKDRIQEPLNGYRDILMNIKMKNEHIVEFRLHLKEMDEVAGGVGHKLYEKVRSIKAKALTANRKLTIDEFNEIKKLEEESLKLYNDAWTKIINK